MVAISVIRQGFKCDAVQGEPGGLQVGPRTLYRFDISSKDLPL